MIAIEEDNMSGIRFYLLGPPGIERDGTPVQVDTAKAIALLAYLVLSGTSQRRETLVGVLWPESDQAHGRAALRRTLSVLNKAIGVGSLLADREAVGLNPVERIWVDVLEFRRRLATCRAHPHGATSVCPDCLGPLREAVTLFGGDFLQGFSLKDSLTFDDWQYGQGELLRRELDDALERLARALSAQGTVEAALDTARRRTALDPLNEAAHCQLMELYARAGHRPAALRQYAQCARILQAELGVTPQRTTTSLYQDIVAGRIGPDQAGDPMEWRLQPVSWEAQPPGITPNAPGAGAYGASAREATAPAASGRAKRIVTVLVADIRAPVAADRPSPSLEEIAPTLGDFVKAASDILTQHGGELTSLSGGSLVAVFGAARAHESDPEQALRAALDMRAGAVRLGLDLSAGVSSGEVIQMRLKVAQAPQMVPVGPPVDVARRLSTAAAPGEILCGEITYRLATRAFDFARLDRETGTGMVYRIANVTPGRGRDATREAFTAELIGRDAELARLEAALADLRGGRGSMVSLVGEAGAGKSRLIRELRALTAAIAYDEGRPAWLEGRCLEIDTLAGYAPFIDIFRAHFGFRSGELDQEACDRVRSGLFDVADQAVLSAERRQEVVPLLCNLLSLQGDDKQSMSFPEYTAEKLKQETFLAVRDVLVALAHLRPVILVLEDLHWADDLSLDLISLLMEALRDSPLLLLCAYRPDPGHRSTHLAAVAARKCRDRYVELRLGELSHEQSAQMVASLLRAASSLPLSASELILERGQGNPFFIEEVVQALLESGLLYEADGRWCTRGHLDRGAVPTTVQQVILGRIDRLDEPLRLLVQTASVIGRVFRRRVLERVTVLPNLERHLWSLEDRGLIYEERAVPELEYSFRHVLVQQALVGSLSGSQRAALHGRVVAAMEALYVDSLAEHCEELAHHAVAAGDAAKAVLYLRQAGEKARRAYDNAAAIDQFTRALELLKGFPPGAERDRRELDIQLALGTSLLYARGHAAPEVAEAYARALEVGREGGDARSRFHALLGLRRYHLHRADLREALKLDEELLAAAQEIGDSAYLARANAMSSETLLRVGEFPRARDHAILGADVGLTSEERLAQSALFGNDNATLGGAILAETSWHLGYSDRASQKMRSVLAEAREAGHPFSLVLALCMGAGLHRLRREPLAASELVQALLAVAQERDYSLYAAIGTVQDGWALAARDPQAACDRIREGIAMYEARGMQVLRPDAYAALAEALGRAGDPARGLEAIDGGLARVEQNGERQWEAELYRIQGDLRALAAADDDMVEASYQRALQVARRQQDCAFELRAALGLGRLRQRQGRAAEARQLLEPLYAWFTEGFDTADLADAHSLLAELA
jgi:DNA-binding SARP family transcriptional activator/class 3 adenylate cyclase